ncbi:MAG: oligosaccharide flippase family protein [Bacteroidales bacterium]|nr:oligosaccharide flippase family protein [Bacteroidales bacterium]
MGVIARQSIKGALANYLGVIIGALTTFFVLTRCLTQEEVGLTRNLVDAAMLFSSLAQLGTNASIIRFFPFFHDGDKNHGIFGWSILIPFIGFCLFALACLAFSHPIMALYADKAPLMANYFYLILPLTFFALYMTVFETNASILMHITVPKMVREVGIRVCNLACYLLYGKGLIGLDLFVALFCASYGLAMLVNLFYLTRLSKITFKIDWKWLTHDMRRDILRYTLFMTATVLAGNIPLINSLFLSAKSGLAATGVYTIASYIANIVEVPYRSLGAISAPVISQHVKDGNWKEVNRLGGQVSLHQLLVAGLIFFFIWTNLRTLFGIIPHGADYIGGMGVVFFMGLAKILNSSLSIGTNILNYSRHYAVSLPCIALLTLSAVLLNQWLIPVWGISGSAVATLLAYVVYFALLLTYLWRHLEVCLFSRQQLATAALVLCLFALSILWDLILTPLITGHAASQAMCAGVWRLVLDSLLRTIVFAAATVAAVHKLEISPDINQMLEQHLFRRLKRK